MYTEEDFEIATQIERYEEDHYLDVRGRKKARGESERETIDLHDLSGWGKNDLIRQIKVYEKQLDWLRGILLIILFWHCTNGFMWSEEGVDGAIEDREFSCICGWGKRKHIAATETNR